MNNKIYVYENFSEDSKLIGALNVEGKRGKELYSFEFSDIWLDSFNANYILDPDISYHSGRQYLSVDKKIFGIFSDSAPDRWGRLLIKRKELLNARKENRKAKNLSELDYLLGVYDQARMGAIRFKLEENGSYMADDKFLTCPPWTTLRELENASIQFELEQNPLNETWLNKLLAPGSSLGGARPKASVLAPDESLWIAKFPSKEDEFDAGAWEMLTRNLAKLCGLNVPEAKIEKFSSYGSTFIIKRFDRKYDKRIHFASAMTLLGKTDGAQFRQDTSYLDLAEFIKSNGAEPNKDLRELFKRIVFFMLVSNTDDHLRNHGFLLKKKGWVLSPLYDVNPSVYGDYLSLNVNENDSSIDLNLALETACYYNIDKEEARKIIGDMQAIVKNNWRILAKNLQIKKDAISYMEKAFIKASE